MSASVAPQPRQHRQSAGRSLHGYLVAIALAALIPGLVASGLALWGVGKSFRDHALERLSMTARTLAAGVEFDLDLLSRALTPPSDDRRHGGDGGERGDSAPAVSHWLGGQLRQVIIGERDSDPLPTDLGIDPGTLRQLVRQGGTAYSNLFEDSEGTLTLSLAIAVDRAPGRTTVAVFSGPPSALVRLPREGRDDAARVLVAVTDGTGRLIARSRGGERFVGRVVPDWAALQAVGADRGRFEARSAEGKGVMMVFETLAGTPGWVLVVGEPMEHFESTWLDPFAGLVIGSLLALLIASAAAIAIGRGILRPVKALTVRSRQIAEASPTPVEVPPSSIREFEQLRRHIEAAENALQERSAINRRTAEQLASSERRYRAIAETGAMAIWRTDVSGQMKSVSSWFELTGTSEAQALRTGWLEVVHAEDKGAISRAWESAAAFGRSIDLEFRVRSALGDWRWVRARGVLSVDDDGHTPECVGVFEDIDARKRALERVAHLAHHDPLTGLANRRLLHDRLDETVCQAVRGRGAALHCLDLDRFKEVNDTLGHSVGDQLLNAVAQRLRQSTRDVDIVARLGGDEFAVIQFDGHRPTGAATLASRLVENLGKPYELGGHHIVIGVSIGIATINDGTRDSDTVLRNADLALYLAKEQGRGCYRFFDPEMDARMRDRLELDLELRRADADDEFQLWYQPTFALQTGALTGFEALMRWNHPQRGVLAPSAFLSPLEESGLIRRIGGRLLNRACLEAAKWDPSLHLSFNLSSAQLLNPDLDEQIEHALHSSGLAPHRLELEIRENTLVDHPDAGLIALQRLHKRGVRLVMDDFGTGRSSLSLLRKLPFHRVKIDRSFVRDAVRNDESRAIVRAVTSLCHDLGIATTAVGIETRAQFELLSTGTCSEAQGYLFGAPKPSPIVLTPPPALAAPGEDRDGARESGPRQVPRATTDA